jgi:hypothetical protein
VTVAFWLIVAGSAAGLVLALADAARHAFRVPCRGRATIAEEPVRNVCDTCGALYLPAPPTYKHDCKNDHESWCRAAEGGACGCRTRVLPPFRSKQLPRAT